MKKDKRFLAELENNLVGIKDKYKAEIISKYENIIKEEKAQNKKITSILKEIGPASEVAQKEMELLGDKGKETFFDNMRNKYNDFVAKRKAEKKLKEEQNANKRMGDKNIKVSVGNNTKTDKQKAKEEKERLKEKERLEKEKKALKEKQEKERQELREKKQKAKEEKEKAKKALKEEKEKEKEKQALKEEKEKQKGQEEPKEEKNKVTFKERLDKFKEYLAKKKQEREERKQRKVTDSPKEVAEEVKEEFEEHVADVAEIVPEEHIFETKAQRRKRILTKIAGVLITTLLLFVWLWVCMLLIASLVAYLDGVKFKGIIIAFAGASLLVLWIVIMVNRAIFRKKMSVTLNLIIIIVSLIMIALGVVLTVKQISEIKTIKDVSVKYSMTTKLNNYSLPTDKEKPFTITFNSNYKTQYVVNYDDKIKDKVKVEVKYYECYYDFFVKQTSNSAYFSLKLDNRDRLSVYIDDLKDGFVFDNDELSRYSVKITINSKDKDRLIILD